MDEMIENILPEAGNEEFNSRIMYQLLRMVIQNQWAREIGNLSDSDRIVSIHKARMLRGKEESAWGGKLFFVPDDNRARLSSDEYVDPDVDKGVLCECGCELTRVSIAPVDFIILPRTTAEPYEAGILEDALRSSMVGLVHALRMAGNKVVATVPDASLVYTANPDIGELNLYGWVGVIEPA
jgi:hypothetical protein